MFYLNVLLLSYIAAPGDDIVWHCYRVGPICVEKLYITQKVSNYMNLNLNLLYLILYVLQVLETTLRPWGH